MRPHILVAIACLLAAAAPARAVDVTGLWAGTWEAVNNPRGPITDNHFMSLKQSGSAITGTTGPKRDVQWEIKNAKLEGNKLTFNASAGTLELAFQLEVTDDAMSGTALVTNRDGISWKVRMKREQ